MAPTATERLEVEAAAPDVLEAVHRLLDAFWEQVPDADGGARARFATAVAEMVGNVVDHGRTAAGERPRLVLQLVAEDDRLTADLLDDGVAVVAPAGGAAADEDAFAERGRGLPLVHAAMDDVRYERQPDHNRWRLVLERAG
jgi:serine/threonine-protein kinase RsbW